MIDGAGDRPDGVIAMVRSDACSEVPLQPSPLTEYAGLTGR